MQRTFDELRRSRRDDPVTSKDAARAARSLAADHRLAIVAALRARGAGEMPMTPHEIGALCGLTSVQVTRRLKELEDDGEIVPAGIGTTPSGRSARCWRLP
jgi:CRP-like cAMP-binding protein